MTPLSTHIIFIPSMVLNILKIKGNSLTKMCEAYQKNHSFEVVFSINETSSSKRLGNTQKWFCFPLTLPILQN